MSENDAHQNNAGPSVEVSVGWNSPSPTVPFPESLDSGDTSTTSINVNTTSGDPPRSKNDRNVDHPNAELLGIYSNLLPGSSPPRPRLRVRKRKPESPLRPNRRSNINLENLAGSMQSVMADPPKVSKTKSILPLDDDDDDDDFAGLRETVNPNAKPNAEKQESGDEGLDDEDDTDSDSDLEDLLKIAAPIRLPQTYFTSRKVLRLVIQNVSELGESILLRCTDSESNPRTVCLKGTWAETVVKRGDIVHILRLSSSGVSELEPTISTYKPNMPPIVIGDDSNYHAIVNPDILVPCTSVAEALSCERQVILRSQVRVPADLNENLVLGTVKHEFIQTCFVQDIFSDINMMKSALRHAAEASSLDLQLVDLDVESAVSKLLPIIPEIQRWAMSIWGPQAAGRQVDLHRSRETFKVRLSRAAYIEEEIRSPHLGLVGKIDITCEATKLQGKGHGIDASRLVGLEIKTGKSTQSTSHRAQTSLYTLLLAERHPYNTHPWSLLYYTETGTTIAVASSPVDTRALIQMRNKVAYEMWHLPSGALPGPTATSDAICNWCSRSDSCILYTAVVDKGNTWGVSSLLQIYTKANELGKLAPTFLQFIGHWHQLLDLEYETSRRTESLRSRQWWLEKPNPTLWTVAKQVRSNDQDGFVYVLNTSLKNKSGTKEALDSTSLKPNDFVIVSTKQHMGTTFGVVAATSDGELEVCVRDRLLTSASYRIDHELWASDSHLGLARFNLNSLISHDRLRELIVELREPQFASINSRKLRTTAEWASSRVLPSSQGEDDTRGPLTYGSNSRMTTSMSTSMSPSAFGASPFPDTHVTCETRDDVDVARNLNDDQTAALNKVLSAKDYTLILGMPGTGKTTTIAAIVASLVERGKSVLLSAYTNSAVDTIVAKLIAAKVRCLRLATSRLESIHPDVLPVTVSRDGTSGGGTSLTDFLECPVIACTSHATNNKLFALRKFDFCILDEASQITLPFCLGPLRLASTFVLVGDHYQLPPLVRNLRAKELGLGDSLFKILCEAHPAAVVELKKQYRMCADIMSLSSELVYGGRLVCGSDAVANQRLEFDFKKVDKTFPNLAAVDPENCVVFLNTDPLGPEAFERAHDEGYSNHAEALIIEGIIQQFSAAGLDMRNVAVISVYRQQLAYLTERLHDFVNRGLEILTADQAQGRDKSCIIVSLVRSNERSQSGELLKDWRRLNVAFTRAKQKLVIVGSETTMQRASGVSSFFEYIERRKWVRNAKLC